MTPSETHAAETKVSQLIGNIASMASLASALSAQEGIGKIAVGAAAVAKAGIALVDQTRDTLAMSSAQVATLNVSHDLLEAAVEAHADRTAASLL